MRSTIFSSWRSSSNKSYLFNDIHNITLINDYHQYWINISLSSCFVFRTFISRVCARLVWLLTFLFSTEILWTAIWFLGPSSHYSLFSLRNLYLRRPSTWNFWFTHGHFPRFLADPRSQRVSWWRWSWPSPWCTSWQFWFERASFYLRRVRGDSPCWWFWDWCWGRWSPAGSLSCCWYWVSWSHWSTISCWRAFLRVFASIIYFY